MERKQDHLFNTSTKMLSKDAWMIGCLYEVTNVVSCLMFPSVTLERDKACLLSGAEAESVGLIVVWIIHLCAVCVRWLVSGPGLYCINKTILLQIKTTFIMEMSHKTHQP